MRKKKTGLFLVYKKASNTPNHLPLSLLHQLAGIYWIELNLWVIVGYWSGWWSSTKQSQTQFKSTWELLFISHHGQAAGGHGDWLEQESGRHVNELNSTYLSRQYKTLKN